MSKVLLLPGVKGAGDQKREILLEAGFDVNIVCFDDAELPFLMETISMPLRNCSRLCSTWIRARRTYPKWLSQAMTAYQMFRPDVVIGSSRGGSIAMSMEIDQEVPILLLAPAYKWFRWIGGSRSIDHPQVTIVHSRQDQLIPFEDSASLCRRCPQIRLVDAGHDRSLVTSDATRIWLQELKRLIQQKDTDTKLHHTSN